MELSEERLKTYARSSRRGVFGHWQVTLERHATVAAQCHCARCPRLQRRAPRSHTAAKASTMHAAGFLLRYVHELHVFHSTRGLVAMTSALHAEGRQFDPGRVYLTCTTQSLQNNMEAQVMKQAMLMQAKLQFSVEAILASRANVRLPCHGGCLPYDNMRIALFPWHPWSSGYDISLTR